MKIKMMDLSNIHNPEPINYQLMLDICCVPKEYFTPSNNIDISRKLAYQKYTREMNKMCIKIKILYKILIYGKY